MQTTYVSSFSMTIWIEGADMFATCLYLTTGNRTFVDTTRKMRMTLENRLWRQLKSEYGVLAQSLKLTYLKGKVQILFDDPEEFILAKMAITNG